MNDRSSGSDHCVLDHQIAIWSSCSIWFAGYRGFRRPGHSKAQHRLDQVTIPTWSHGEKLYLQSRAMTTIISHEQRFATLNVLS